MTNKVMIDSSLFVEYIKGRKKKLFTELIASLEFECYINETVVSEFFYHFLHVNGMTSPLALQSSKKIKDILESNFSQDMLQRFLFLPTDNRLYLIVPLLMKKYNLLPNDAIILATCKIHSITRLASHDADFINPCKAEEIELLREQ